MLNISPKPSNGYSFIATGYCSGKCKRECWCDYTTVPDDKWDIHSLVLKIDDDYPDKPEFQGQRKIDDALVNVWAIRDDDDEPIFIAQIATQ